MELEQTLLELPLANLLEQVAEPSPLPGSGPVAALVTALAASLVTMAARLSTDWEDAGGAAAQAESLRRRVVPLAEQDADAYADVLRIRKEPEGIDPEIRDFALGQAFDLAAAVPLSIAEAAADVAELAHETAQFGEPSVRGDVIAASVLAAAAARTCATLVAVNLTTTDEDPRVGRVHDVAHSASYSSQRALELAD